ncbi:MAG: PAS domain S-box protein [Methanospirillaceae archaeon]|nr:PAS domain S-box protein [Methanospirillaceae archaeon]
MLFTLVDVTEQEAAGAVLRDSEAPFHEMFELVGEAVFLVDDKTGRICEANKEAERMYGYTHDELIGLTNAGISAEPEKTQGIVEHRENGTFFIPLRYHQRKDGTLFPVEATGRFFTYKGRQMHVVACRDISTRKEAEEELQRSEEWYRRIVETAQEGIWVLDRSFQTTHLNIHMAEMLGYSQNEMKGRPITDFLHPDELSDYRIMAGERRKGVPRTFERKFIRKDGSVCWGLVSSTPIFTNNVFTGSFSMITDITGRKEAEEKSVRTYYDLQKIYDNLSATEEELREQYRILSQKQQELIASEERYRQLFTSMTSGFAHHRILCDDGGMPVDYEFIDINPAFVTITGLPRDKIVHKRVLDVLPDTEASWIERYGHTALTGEPQIFELYNRVFDKYFDVSVYSPEEGEFITLFSDITQRKKMEEALIESEARYRNVVEDQTELIARTRPDGTHLFVNEAYCRYFGRERDEMIGRRFHPEIHPEDRSSLKIFFASFSQKNPMGTIDQRTITDNREIRWQRWNNRAVFDKNGKIVEIQSVGRDITDTKRAEEALLASEKKFRNLVELAQEGIWSVDAEYLTIYVNPKMADLLGYTQEEMKGRPISEFLDPSWLSSGMEYPKKQMMGLKEEFECAFRKKNNEIILASVSTGPLSDEQGTITGAIAVVMDITRKKRLEKQQQVALQRIEENIHQMAVLNDQIRNPLTIISILCEEDTPGSCEKILEQINRIDSLVREVDKGFVLSLKIRDFLRDYHGIDIPHES